MSNLFEEIIYSVTRYFAAFRIFSGSILRSCLYLFRRNRLPIAERGDSAFSYFFFSCFAVYLSTVIADKLHYNNSLKENEQVILQGMYGFANAQTQLLYCLILLLSFFGGTHLLIKNKAHKAIVREYSLYLFSFQTTNLIVLFIFWLELSYRFNTDDPDTSIFIKGVVYMLGFLALCYISYLLVIWPESIRTFATRLKLIDVVLSRKIKYFTFMPHIIATVLALIFFIVHSNDDFEVSFIHHGVTKEMVLNCTTDGDSIRVDTKIILTNKTNELFVVSDDTPMFELDHNSSTWLVHPKAYEFMLFKSAEGDFLLRSEEPQVVQLTCKISKRHLSELLTLLKKGNPSDVHLTLASYNFGVKNLYIENLKILFCGKEYSFI